MGVQHGGFMRWIKCSKKLPQESGNYYVKCKGDRLGFYIFCPYNAEKKQWTFAGRDNIIKWKPMERLQTFWNRPILRVDSDLLFKSIFW